VWLKNLTSQNSHLICKRSLLENYLVSIVLEKAEKMMNYKVFWVLKMDPFLQYSDTYLIFVRSICLQLLLFGSCFFFIKVHFICEINNMSCHGQTSALT